MVNEISKWQKVNRGTSQSCVRLAYVEMMGVVLKSEIQALLRPVHLGVLHGVL